MIFLEAAAGGFGGLALGDIGEQKYKTEHAVRGREDRIAAHQKRARLLAGPQQCNFAAPGSPQFNEILQPPAGFRRRIEKHSKVIHELIGRTRLAAAAPRRRDY